MPKRAGAIAAVSVVALVVAAVAVGGSSPDVTVLAKQARTLVRSQAVFAKAVLLEADGTPATAAKVKTAAAIVNWRFVFDNQRTGSKYASAFVWAHSGTFGKVKGNVEPFLEDEVISPVPQMTLARAVTLLNAAGYKAGFYNVTLRKPLYPGVTSPFYFFTLGNLKYVAVNTTTGKVKPVSG